MPLLIRNTHAGCLRGFLRDKERERTPLVWYQSVSNRTNWIEAEGWD